METVFYRIIPAGWQLCECQSSTFSINFFSCAHLWSRHGLRTETVYSLGSTDNPDQVLHLVPPVSSQQNSTLFLDGNHTGRGIYFLDTCAIVPYFYQRFNSTKSLLDIDWNFVSLTFMILPESPTENVMYYQYISLYINSSQISPLSVKIMNQCTDSPGIHLFNPNIACLIHW